MHPCALDSNECTGINVSALGGSNGVHNCPSALNVGSKIFTGDRIMSEDHSNDPSVHSSALEG